MITQLEAMSLIRAMCRRWPHPEVDEEGQRLLAASLAATRLNVDDLEEAIRHLMAHRTSGFRPEPGEIAELVRQRILPARVDATRSLPAAGQVVTKREMYRGLAEATAAAINGRKSLEARIGRRVEQTESGTMRHISTALAIGPVTITGREALGTDLAVELLARHDAA